MAAYRQGGDGLFCGVRQCPWKSLKEGVRAPRTGQKEPLRLCNRAGGARARKTRMRATICRRSSSAGTRRSVRQLAERDMQWTLVRPDLVEDSLARDRCTHRNGFQWRE